MKFSWRQLFASVGGAILAAVIASLFGVKGTIVGVAIGSAAATMGTALVAQSIERGHQAVKKVAVMVPEKSTLLRRLGGTTAVGEVETPPNETTVPADEPTIVQSQPDDTVVIPSQPDDTIVIPAGVAADVTLPLFMEEPVTAEMQRPIISRNSIPWKAISATAAVVFVLSLGTVTVIELVVGHPFADIFGPAKSGTSVGGFINPGPATPTTSTTTTSTSTTTTSTSTTTTTTSTTVPGGSTTTTVPGATTTTVPSTTTTSGLGGLFGSTTTTTTP